MIAHDTVDAVRWLRGAVFLGVAACSYDWSVRGFTPADGGAAPAADASVGVDAGADAPAVEAAADARADTATVADAAPCADLVAAVADRRAKARVCIQGTGQCGPPKQVDHCGCELFVADPTSAAAADLRAAVAQAKGSGCLDGCPAACTPVVVGAGTCLQKPDTTFECSP
jgi:hypothetical protein